MKRGRHNNVQDKQKLVFAAARDGALVLSGKAGGRRRGAATGALGGGRGKSADALQLTGTVESRIQTDLGFRVLGRIIARNVDVADLVKKGDVVASIDPLALELSVKSAQSDLSNAEAQLANAVTTEQRQRVLAEARSGTEAALEEAQQATRTANASVAKARANLDKAEEQLGYAQLHAEFDGVVTATSGEIGQVVSAGQTVVTIARPEVRDVVVDVPQFAAQRLDIGSTFEIALQLDPKSEPPAWCGKSPRQPKRQRAHDGPRSVCRMRRRHSASVPSSRLPCLLLPNRGSCCRHRPC